MREAYFFVFVLLFGLGGCSSQMKLTKPTGFVVQEASCYTLLPGREESGRQLMLEVYISEIPSGVEAAEVLFRGQVNSFSMTTLKGRPVMKAFFNLDSEKKPDLIMHGDSSKEGGNQPPRIQPLLKEFPFELQKNEAVFRYKKDDKYTYFKVGSIQEGKTKVGI